MLSVSEVLTGLSLVIAFLSVCISFYSVRQARKTALTGTYFSEMVQAYSEYLRRVSEFALQRGLAERNALVVALYRLQLFASPEIFSDAQELYAFLLSWAKSNPSDALAVDDATYNLGVKMCEHLKKIRERGYL